MDVSDFIGYLKTRPYYQDQIVHIEHIPARTARLASTEQPLESHLEASLQKQGVSSLYTHQAEAVDLVRQGQNVMVSTPSASGKSLCYNIPVLQSLLTEKGSRAVYIFPTKALAQDQLRALRKLACPDLFSPEEFATFDGDTPQAERTALRKNASVILTNPDMLHAGILPNPQMWASFLSRLRYVVVDEAHVYRGVFGSHVACVLRRLYRLCRLYGGNPHFILCSATIANPGEHAEKLTGLPFAVVDHDGSPHGGREFVFWEPPIVDIAKSNRRSPNSEATVLFTELVSRDIRTLAFARTRRLTELIYSYSRDRLAETDPALSRRIRAYRAGYLAQDRRQIEQELFHGTLTGVVATVALELGVDIGNLDATILTGYPGSIASAWQQAGRSGRSKKTALTFLIGLDNPLDQYLMRHPEFFFQKSVENAIINPENPHILKAHLLCAAWESPLEVADERLFGPSFDSQVKELAELGWLRMRRGRWHVSSGIGYPAQNVNIRSTSGESFTLVDGASGAILENVESGTAFFQVHAGAVYIHQGETYLVTEFDLATRTAVAVPAALPYYTQTNDFTNLRIIRTNAQKQCGPVTVYLGEVEVSTAIVSFKKKAQFTEEVLGEEPLELPEQSFRTMAFWFDLPPAALARVDEMKLDLAGGLHATEHAAIGLLPLFALCDRNDIGGVSTPLHPDTGRPQIFIHDAHPGGVGIAEKGFELIRELWQATLRNIAECPCQDGCPGCVHSPKCGNNNRPLDKKAAVVLLEGLLAEPQ